MDKAGLQSDPRRARLLGYLQNCAAGLKRWQDQTTGCWYQLLAHDGDFSVTDYKTKDNSETIKSGTKTNYLESSATAIFTATILKGMRLGYLDRATYEPMAKKAYHGFLKQFLRKNIDGNAYGLINCCASAGLGGEKNTDKKRRTGSAAYYLLGSDVTKVEGYTEGKVLGAFILAATEYERAYLKPQSTGDLSCNCLKVALQ
jgi:rhamnogalacturonyl hydrolase YesR